MARVLTGLALLALLAAGVWLRMGAVREGPGRPGAPEVAAHPPARAPEAAIDAAVEAPIDPTGAETTPGGLATPEPLAPDGDAGRRAVLEPEKTAGTGDLLVRVVDPEGRPIGEVPVAVGPQGGEPQEDGASDGDGLLLFPGLRATWLDGAVQPWVLRHEIPFSEPPELVLTRAVLSRSPVVSVQPWSGTVEVVVETLDGEPAPDGSEVELALVSEEEAIDPSLAFERPSWRAQTRAGRAVFSFAELGREWEAAARRPGSEVWSRARGPGPAARGEVATIGVVLGSDHAVLAFRAVDEAGSPFRDSELELEENHFFGFPDRSKTRTDADGWFTIDLSSGWLFGSGKVVVTHRSAEGVELRGRAELGSIQEPGLHRRGDVVLSPDPVIAAGRVVDDGGRAVPGARVVAGKGGFGASLLDRQRWGWGGRTFEARGDEGGAFELRGLLADDDVDLQAEKGGLVSEVVHAHAGDRDVVLVLTPRFVLTGSLLLDPEVDPGQIELRLLAPGPDGEREVGTDVDRREAGAFAIQDVAPGLYALECRLEERRLARLERIDVRADTELGAIDLRGAVHRFEIELVGGSEGLAGEVSWRESGSEEWKARNFEGELIELLAPFETIDVWVRPRDFRHVRLERVTGRAQVVLEAPLRVRLQLETDGRLPSYPYLFDPDLMQDDVHVGFAEGSGYFTDEHRSVVFLVSVAGKVRVKWHLEHRIENGAVGANVLGEQEIELDVMDVGGEQVFVVPLDGEALTRLTERPPF